MINDLHRVFFDTPPDNLSMIHILCFDNSAPNHLILLPEISKSRDFGGNYRLKRICCFALFRFSGRKLEMVIF